MVFTYVVFLYMYNISHECAAIASLPLTTHQLMELCKTKSDEPDG